MRWPRSMYTIVFGAAKNFNRQLAYAFSTLRCMHQVWTFDAPILAPILALVLTLNFICTSVRMCTSKFVRHFCYITCQIKFYGTMFCYVIQLHLTWTHILHVENERKGLNSMCFTNQIMYKCSSGRSYLNLSSQQKLFLCIYWANAKLPNSRRLRNCVSQFNICLVWKFNICLALTRFIALKAIALWLSMML